MMEHALPPGWSYNPCAWRDRLPLVGLAALGFAAAFYTGFYQLGIVPHLWDPFFGSQSSYLVTHSVVSRILPFPDGLLGLIGYFCDMLFGALGGADRWRRAPWLVLVFCAIITAMATVSVLLTITMGVLVRHWCTVCLFSASISTLIFGLGVGEALPALQYLTRVYGDTGALGAVWRAAWGNGACEHTTRRAPLPLPIAE